MNQADIEDKLRKRLHAHDWYYSRASDPKKWSEGSSNEYEIDRLMKMLPKSVAQAIYAEYAPKPAFPAKAPIIRRMRRKSSGYVMAVTPEEKRSSGINLPGKHILDNALVDEASAAIYGNAVACDNARVMGDVKAWGQARIGGNSLVFGAVQVTGSARIYGKATVHGRARVSDEAQVFGSSKVRGKANIFGKAKVSGDAVVEGNAFVLGDAVILGKARISGDAEIRGGVWDGSEGEVSTGVWISPGIPGGAVKRFLFMRNLDKTKYQILRYDGKAFLIGNKSRKGVFLGPVSADALEIRNLLSDHLSVRPEDLTYIRG